MKQVNSDDRQNRHQYREGDNPLAETENHHQKRSIMSLSKARIGNPLWIAGYESKDGINRLLGMGLAPGMSIEVLQNLAGNLLLAVGESRIGVDGGMAKRIMVSDKPFDYLVELEEVNDMENTKTTLRDLQVNQRGKLYITKQLIMQSKKLTRKSC